MFIICYRITNYCTVCAVQESSVLSWTLDFRNSGIATYPQGIQPGWGLIWRQDSVPQGMLDWEHQFLASYCLEATLSSLLLEPLQKGSLLLESHGERGRERESPSKMELTVFSNLITEVMFFHFFCILLIPSQSLGPVYAQGKEYQEGDP